MISVDQLCAENHLQVSDTAYRNSKKKMLEFQIVSNNHYAFFRQGEQNLLKYKNSVEIADFPMLTQALSHLQSVDYLKKNDYPYFTAGLPEIAGKIKAGEPVAVEGGPCLFGTDEVTAEVTTKTGAKLYFDYSTGRSCREDDACRENGSFGTYTLLHGPEIREIHFENKKTALTLQEWAFIKHPFEIANALRGPLVIPIPDFSYMKYLDAVLQNTDDGVRRNAMEEFRKEAHKITDLYLELIQEMQGRYHGMRCEVVHDRATELCERFYRERAPYIERHKVLRILTGIPEKLESIKDYVSMPALPYYLFGIPNVVQVDSMNETDSYRKCKMAHKGVLTLACLLFPELLSSDSVHTIFDAPFDRKEYGNYGK